MINFTTLINETETLTDLEELESAKNLFQYGISKAGCYTIAQSIQFNKTYTSSLNRILTEDLCKSNINFKYLTILEIVTLAPAKMKEDNKRLNMYVRDIMKNLCGKCA
jgi:hypothetical protein